jgi:hypothetical protein
VKTLRFLLLASLALNVWLAYGKIKEHYATMEEARIQRAIHAGYDEGIRSGYRAVNVPTAPDDDMQRHLRRARQALSNQENAVATTNSGSISNKLVIATNPASSSKPLLKPLPLATNAGPPTPPGLKK